MNTNLQNFRTNEVIKSKIESGEFDSKKSFRYYINYINLIYQIALKETTQQLKKEFDINDDSIKAYLNKEQLDRVYLADLLVADLLNSGLKYKEIKETIIINQVIYG